VFSEETRDGTLREAFHFILDSTAPTAKRSVQTALAQMWWGRKLVREDLLHDERGYGFGECAHLHRAGQSRMISVERRKFMT
jgi:hypothetical protein